MESIQPVIQVFMSPIFHVAMLIVFSVGLFISDKLPMDGVAFLVLIALLFSGIVPEQEAVSGFANTATVTIAAMFVISAGLQRTGIVQWIANRMSTVAGRSATQLNAVLMTSCGFLSAFISNTATVAVLLPVALRLSKERNISPSTILMPLSFAAQFGGVCTLVGTTSNLLVNAVAQEHGVGFSVFEFAKLGLVCFVAGTLYMLIAARFLLQKEGENNQDSEDLYRLKDYLVEMKVLPGSPLIGQTSEDSVLRDLGELSVLEIVRGGQMIWAPQKTEIREGDILLIRGPVDVVMDAESRLKLMDWAEQNLSEQHLRAHDIALMEVMLPGNSRIIGRTLTQMDFYWRYHAAVLGVRRRGAVLRERIAHLEFERGDTLLLQGHQKDLMNLTDEKDFVTLQDLSQLKLKKRHAVFSVAILVGMLAVVATGAVSLLAGALSAAGLMVFSRCLNLSEAYEAVDMRVVLLLACLIPLGHAMDFSGASAQIEWLTMHHLGAAGPFAAMVGIYLITMVLSAVMSNAATAVLLAPLAVSVAHGLNVSPVPLLMAVTFAASTCFTTPIGYQTNTMVYGPGGYKYIDFVKVGLPLNLLLFAISVFMIPVFWPF